MVTSKIILCSGGSRSGKSEFAEKLALSLPGRKAYIATARIYDKEIEERVALHKKRRGTEWYNCEIPLHISASLTEICENADVLLLDCLTMYTMNYLMEHEEDGQAENVVLEELRQLLENLKKMDNKTLICVTNEIGLGIVPDNALSRLFRDIAGRVNRYIASESNEVYFTVSGITIEIKSKGVTIDG